MATLDDLKTRIIDETNRDDMGAGGQLEAALTRCITQAIEFYADEQFWFNRASGTVTTDAGDATADLPTGVRSARAVAYNGCDLVRVPLGSIVQRIETGLPDQWAENNGALQLWPIPSGSYDLMVVGVAELGVPTTSNAWTVEGYDLIAARTRYLLYRDYLKDTEAATLAGLAEDEALTRLRRETRRRGSSPLKTELARFSRPTASDIGFSSSANNDDPGDLAAIVSG